MNLKDKYFAVLDDGFIALKDYMGSDEDIEQAARVSYGKGTRKVSDTTNLIRYLMRHRHGTPTEMCEMKFHVRLPIYVARQWMRHRMQSYNEYSGRYSEMIDSMEKTNFDKWRVQSGNNKQGSDGFVSDELGSHLSKQEKILHEDITSIYKERLNEGVAKEQARKDLPVSNYTEFYCKTDLRNWFSFLSLRCDSHAQYEIRQYANIIGAITYELFPISSQAWLDYDFSASVLTFKDKLLLQDLMAENSNFFMLQSPVDVDVKYRVDLKIAESLGMNTRELAEFWGKFKTDTDINVFNIALYSEYKFDK